MAAQDRFDCIDTDTFFHVKLVILIKMLAIYECLDRGGCDLLNFCQTKYLLLFLCEKPAQARSQAEARKPGLQHHMGLDARNPDYVTCEQQGA